MSYELKVQQDKIFGENNIIIMDDIPEYNTIDYDLYNEKEFDKYIYDIEKTARSSMEYQVFVQYLREYMDMNKCAFFKNINNIHTTKIKIHLHHYPFTLYDIALTVYAKRCKYKESLEVELVAKEVMYIHYFLYIGLVPLAETAHQLVHNQLLFIPLDIVLGKYKDFIEMYEQFIPEEAMERYHTYQDLTENYNEAINLQILKTTPIYLRLPGDYNIEENGLVPMKQLLDLVKEKLDSSKKIPDNIIIDTSYYDNNIKEDSEPRKKLIKPYIIET